VDVDAAGQAIIAELRRTGAADLLLLRYVPESAAATAWLKRRAAATIPQGPAPFLRLDNVDSFQSLYEARISKSLRSQRARKRRRLADLGPLSLDIAAASPAALAQLQAGLAQKRAWAAERGLQSAMLTDPASEALMTACATAHPGFVCYTMRAGDEQLGFVLGLKGRGQVIFLITAFRAAHERHSPGQIMLEDLVALWHREGLSEIDLGNGLNAYKLEWTDAAVAHTDYAVALSAAGMAYAYGSLRIVQPVLRRIYFALPDTWRRRIMAVVKRRSAASERIK
jgi:CelD/BcsL family acetyltransferase involved in cellulose biosynthesis